MSEVLGRIPVWLIVMLVVIAVGLYCGFWILEHYFIPRIKGRKWKQITDRYHPLIHTFAWIGFTIFASYRLLRANPLVSGILIFLLMLAAWQFLRDFIAGLWIRIDGKLKPGVQISIDEVKGSLVSLHTRHILLRSETGDPVLIPYRKLNNARLSWSQQSTGPGQGLMTLHIPEHYDGHILTRDILAAQLSVCPWTDATYEPVIRHSESDFVVQYKPIDAALHEEVRDYLLNRISSENGDNR